MLCYAWVRGWLTPYGQAWQRAPLPTEPSHQPPEPHFFVLNSTIILDPIELVPKTGQQCVNWLV